MVLLYMNFMTHRWVTAGAWFSFLSWAKCFVQLTLTAFLCPSLVAPLSVPYGILGLNARQKSICSLKVCPIAGFHTISPTVKGMLWAELLFLRTSRTSAGSSVQIIFSPLRRSSGPFSRSDRCFFADVIAHLGLPLKLNMVDSDSFRHLHVFFVDVFVAAMKTEGV